ncbi:rRNA-binding ribosome biosynthesis protein utp25, partial [Serendipita sp. 400]
MTSLIKQTNQSTTTRLLTLLNVSATSLKKRKREEAEEQANGKTRVVSTTPIGGIKAPPIVKKLNARKEVIVIDEGATPSGEDEGPNDEEMDSDVEMEDKGHKESEGGKDPYNAHFGPDSSYLSDSTRISVDNRKWTTSDQDVGKLGRACVLLPEGATSPGHNAVTGLLDKLQATFEDQLLKKFDLQLCKNLLTTIGSYQDLYLTKRDLKSQSAYREVISLHILNHIMKKRRRILKNNEKLSSLQKDADPSDSNAFLDQGFVRPSVLVVLPFRSSAYHWITAFIHQLSGYQVENRARFHSEFTLPAGAEDKLLSAPAGTYSEDHVANMSGNIDDYFRIGMKVTRKSVKLFSDFYSSDIIVA